MAERFGPDDLGIEFEDTAKPEEGRRFFRSTLVQTLFYGVFSAWVLWHRSRPKEKDKFDWKQTTWLLQVPVIRKLFHELAEPGKQREWKLDEVPPRWVRRGRRGWSRSCSRGTSRARSLEFQTL